MPQLSDNVGVQPRKKPIRISPLLLPIYLPLMFVGGALSIPYTMIRRKVVARHEARFADSMRGSGRVMDWADFSSELERGNGMLIVERFSFKGPIRLWWTRENLYRTCPYPLVDWLTITMDAGFDPIRDWCHTNYTGATGRAMLIIAGKDQWRTIRGDEPLGFRDGVQFLEIPPPRKS
jgi:hypothetical protein